MDEKPSWSEIKGDITVVSFILLLWGATAIINHFCGDVGGYYMAAGIFAVAFIVAIAFGR